MGGRAGPGFSGAAPDRDRDGRARPGTATPPEHWTAPGRAVDPILPRPTGFGALPRPWAPAGRSRVSGPGSVRPDALRAPGPASGLAAREPGGPRLPGPDLGPGARSPRPSLAQVPRASASRAPMARSACPREPPGAAPGLRAGTKSLGPGPRAAPWAVAGLVPGFGSPPGRVRGGVPMGLTTLVGAGVGPRRPRAGCRAAPGFRVSAGGSGAKPQRGPGRGPSGVWGAVPVGSGRSPCGGSGRSPCGGVGRSPGGDWGVATEKGGWVG